MGLCFSFFSGYIQHSNIFTGSSSVKHVCVQSGAKISLFLTPNFNRKPFLFKSQNTKPNLLCLVFGESADEWN